MLASVSLNVNLGDERVCEIARYDAQGRAVPVGIARRSTAPPHQRDLCQRRDLPACVRPPFSRCKWRRLQPCEHFPSIADLALALLAKLT